MKQFWRNKLFWHFSKTRAVGKKMDYIFEISEPSELRIEYKVSSNSVIILNFTSPISESGDVNKYLTIII